MVECPQVQSLATAPPPPKKKKKGERVDTCSWEYTAADVAPWKSACQACARPWLHPQRGERWWWWGKGLHRNPSSWVWIFDFRSSKPPFDNLIISCEKTCHLWSRMKAACAKEPYDSSPSPVLSTKSVSPLPSYRSPTTNQLATWVWVWSPVFLAGGPSMKGLFLCAKTCCQSRDFSVLGQ